MGCGRILGILVGICLCLMGACTGGYSLLFDKGAGQLGGFIIAGIMFVPGIVIFILAATASKYSHMCPYCKEGVNKDAVVCPHCRRELASRQD